MESRLDEERVRAERLLNDARTERDRVAGERDGLVGERDSLVGERDSLIGERDSLVGERDSLIGERDSLIGERNGLIGERDRLIGERDHHARSFDAARGRALDLDASLNRTRAEVGALRRSLSWRVTAPLRAVYSGLRRLAGHETRQARHKR